MIVLITSWYLQQGRHYRHECHVRATKPLHRPTLHPLWLQPLVLLDDQIKLDQDLPILFVRPTAVKVPSGHVELVVEIFEQGKLYRVVDRHVVLDRIQRSENEVLETHLRK